MALYLEKKDDLRKALKTENNTSMPVRERKALPQTSQMNCGLGLWVILLWRSILDLEW